MNRIKVIAVVLGMVGMAEAQDDFEVNSVIHPAVAKLDPPKLRAGFVQGGFAISTREPKAAEHVKQGIAQLHAPWDFEAYRHFCAAASADPDCLMAYWGITMSLAGHNHEFYRQRKAAVERMIFLLEEEKGVVIEQGYALAAIKLITDGALASGEDYQEIARQFPNDIHSRLWGAFLTRDGFAETGEPLLRQKQSTKNLRQILEQYPDNVSVLAFWVLSQSEAPLDSIAMSKDVLPSARKLVELHPDFPVFQLVRTHLEAKCGNAALAVIACEKAITLYEAYMKAEKVTVYDCDGWIRAKVYLANLKTTLGHYERSLPITAELAAVKVEEARLFSRGANLLLWEGRTMGARLAMGRSTSEEWNVALKQLEVLPIEEWYEKKSLAVSYRDTLAFCLGVRKALAAKDLKAAKGLFARMLQHAKSVEGMQPIVAKTSSYSDWVRARKTMGVLVFELRAMLLMEEEGAAKLGAANFLKSAIDRQKIPSNLLPPPIDYPIEAILGDFYLSVEKFGEAAVSYREGLERFPNHVATLEGYQKALTRLGRKEDAEQVRKRILLIKG